MTPENRAVLVCNAISLLKLAGASYVVRTASGNDHADWINETPPTAPELPPAAPALPPAAAKPPRMQFKVEFMPSLQLLAPGHMRFFTVPHGAKPSSFAESLRVAASKLFGARNVSVRAEPFDPSTIRVTRAGGTE